MQNCFKNMVSRFEMRYWFDFINYLPHDDILVLRGLWETIIEHCCTWTDLYLLDRNPLLSIILLSYTTIWIESEKITKNVNSNLYFAILIFFIYTRNRAKRNNIVTHSGVYSCVIIIRVVYACVRLIRLLFTIIIIIRQQ